MKIYILRDIYSGKLYRVYAYDVPEAKEKVNREKGVPVLNLHRVQKQHARSSVAS